MSPPWADGNMSQAIAEHGYPIKMTASDCSEAVIFYAPTQDVFQFYRDRPEWSEGVPTGDDTTKEVVSP